MSDPRGLINLSAGGRDYKLWLGMSVIADLQAKHGQDVIQRLQPPADAPENWMPDFQIIVDLILSALQRFHADDADRYVVDEILQENLDLLPRLLAAAFPSGRKTPEAAAKPGK